MPTKIQRINVDAVIKGNASPLENALLNKLLHENEQKKDPIQHFSGFRDAFLVDETKGQAFDLANPHPNYRNAYVCVRENAQRINDNGQPAFHQSSTDAALNGQPVKNITVYYVDDNLNVVELPKRKLNDAVTWPADTEMPCTAGITNIALDRAIRAIPDVEIDPTMSIYEQIPPSNNKESEHFREKFNDHLKSIPIHRYSQDHARYPVTHKKENYEIELSHPILLRESAHERASFLSSKKRTVYEAHEPTPFYSAEGKVALFNTIGMIKPTSGETASTNHNHTRIIKNTPIQAQEQVNTTLATHKAVERKIDHMHYKKPVIDRVNDETTNIYSTMKKIEGQGVDAFIANHAQNENYKTEKYQVMENAIRAVAELHSLEITHNDIKPGNFITKDGNVQLIDFDDARPTNSSIPAHNFTAEYAAPEVTSPADLNKKTDVYALGLTLLGIETHEKIHQDNVEEKVESIKHKEIKTVIKSALAFEADKRPTADALQKSFREAQIAVQNKIENLKKDTPRHSAIARP